MHRIMPLHKRLVQNVVISSCLVLSKGLGRPLYTKFLANLNRTNGSRSNKRWQSSLKTSKRSHEEILQVAIEAAKQAGLIMKRTTGQIEVSKTKVNTADLVTASDLECQQVIRKIILNAFPMDQFLGEEDIEAGRSASVAALKKVLSHKYEESESYLWIVDPIDGTTNFQAGLPMFGASIGVVKLSNTVTSPEIVVGVIYNPILDELTCAVRGEGCFLNGNRIVHKQVPDDFRIELKDALVCVGFPASSPSALVASSKAVSVLSSKVRGIRMIASAAQVMCWVAQGKLSAYIGWNLNAWDAAAGILIIEESGGCLRNFDGTKADISSRDMIMTCYENKYHHHHLNDEIRQLMARTNCLEYDHL